MSSDLILASGYRFAAVHCGVRPDRDRLDLALVVSDRPAAAAGVFTQNCVAAAPVHVCRDRLPRDDARGVVICAGNANACTGERGLDDAKRMAAVAAESIGCRPEQMLVASTGVIGRHLPMSNLEAGIPKAVAALADTPAAFDAACQAILTTDTRIKAASRSIQIPDGSEIRVTGFAKGAAMIGPNMATMLAFILTDASIPPAPLHATLSSAVDESFNRISVEGHTSTNDTVLLFANGPGQNVPGSIELFHNAVSSVCVELAKAIVADAEGAEHLVTIEVEGLPTDGEARRVAKVVAESALVKSAIFGADPNWGRFVSAAGYAGVPFAEKDLSCWLGDTLLYKDGVPVPFDVAAASAYLRKNREVTLRLKFAFGDGYCRFWTCDLTPEYVRLNSDYTT